MRITLCGSAKFEDRFHEWNKKLTLAGHTVYGLAVYPSYMSGDKNWYTEGQKTTLDLIHLDKILNSDAILVLDEGEYYGDSTRREIEWARIQGKKVYWMTSCSKNIISGDIWAGDLL